MVKTRRQSYGYSRNIGGQRETGNAEGGTRTPTPFRAQRPERCVSTNFTTSAQALYYCIPCDLSRGFSLRLTPSLLEATRHCKKHWLRLKACLQNAAAHTPGW